MPRTQQSSKISKKSFRINRKMYIFLTLIIFAPILFTSCSSTNENSNANNLLLNCNALQGLYRSVVEKVRPSIVAISTQNSFDVGFGTGVIIDESGLILTSEHVVSNAKKISILLNNQRIFDAKTISADETTDLAILKIDDAENLVPIEFGDSSMVKVGDIVFALGNAFGHSSRDGQPTVTQGIISALSRVATSLTTNRRYWDAIQHDASVNPGNSGGPLVDITGKMIGLNGVINSKTGSNAGVSFAVPVNIIKKFLPALKLGKKIEHPYLGISELNNVITKTDELEIRGVQIGAVSPESPASKAGLQNLDIVIGADSKNLVNTVELYNWLYNKNPGDIVVFQILRFKKDNTKVEVKLIEFKLGTIPAKKETQ